MLALSAFNQVVEKWRKDGEKFLPPYNETEIIETFKKLNHNCSTDVVALYYTIGGMDDGGINSECFNLWSLEGMVKENTVNKHPYIAFADFLLHSHWYFFKYEGENVSSVYTDWSEGGRLIKIADNVNEFFEIYLHNSGKLGLF